MASTGWKTFDVGRLSNPPGDEAHPHFHIHTSVHELGGIGGDLVDVRREADDAISMTLADLTGHGSEAAPYAGRLQGVLRGLDDHSFNQRSWLTHVNERLCDELDDEHFCAAIHVRMKWSSRYQRVLVSLANAGMPAPLVYRAATRRVECWTGVAPPLGVFAGVDRLPHPTGHYLEPGDTLVLFSDGLTEARDAGREMFGEHRIARIVRTLGPASGSALLSSLTSAVSRFVRGPGQQDDLAVVAVEVPITHELTARTAAA